MVVCAHGEVAKFCEKHEMKILESYNGDLGSYKGSCAVVVTDQQMTREEYDDLKCTLFSRGVELISTDWTDDDVIVRLLHNQMERRKKRGGKQMFGFYRKNGVICEKPEQIAVARRIIELRDAGLTLKGIQADSSVRHQNNQPLSISTIQVIIKNRGVYEK